MRVVLKKIASVSAGGLYIPAGYWEKWASDEVYTVKLRSCSAKNLERPIKYRTQGVFAFPPTRSIFCGISVQIHRLGLSMTFVSSKKKAKLISRIQIKNINKFLVVSGKCWAGIMVNILKCLQKGYKNTKLFCQKLLIN